MKDLIQPFTDLIKALVQPEKGTKFLLTAMAIGAIYAMHWKGFSTEAADLSIAGLIAVYYIADICAKIFTKQQECCCDDEEPEEEEEVTE